jgi:hypothetical protein
MNFAPFVPFLVQTLQSRPPGPVNRSWPLSGAVCAPGTACRPETGLGVGLPGECHALPNIKIPSTLRNSTIFL